MFLIFSPLASFEYSTTIKKKKWRLKPIGFSYCSAQLYKTDSSTLAL